MSVPWAMHSCVVSLFLLLCAVEGSINGSNGSNTSNTTAPTSAPTVSPTMSPTVSPTMSPSFAPTAAPTIPPWWTCYPQDEIDTTLRSITITMGMLVPSFDPGNFKYTVVFEAGDVSNHTGELWLNASLATPCAYLNGSRYTMPTATPSPPVLTKFHGSFQTSGLYRVSFDLESDTVFRMDVVDDRGAVASYEIKIPAAASADGLATPVLPPGHSCQDIGRLSQPGGTLDAELGGWQSDHAFHIENTVGKLFSSHNSFHYFLKPCCVKGPLHLKAVPTMQTFQGLRTKPMVNAAIGIVMGMNH